MWDDAKTWADIVELVIFSRQHKLLLFPGSVFEKA